MCLLRGGLAYGSRQAFFDALKEFNRIYLSCPEAVRETLMDSIRTLAKHLTEFYSKIENP